MKEFEQSDSYIIRVRQTRRYLLSFVAMVLPIIILFGFSYSSITTSTTSIFLYCFISGMFLFLVWICYKISIIFPLSPDPKEYNGCRHTYLNDGTCRCIWCGNWYGLENTGETCSSRYHAKQISNHQMVYN